MIFLCACNEIVSGPKLPEVTTFSWMENHPDVFNNYYSAICENHN